MEKLKVLAVADPAVQVYVDEQYKIIEGFEDKSIEVVFDIVPWEDYFPTMMEAFKGKADYDIIMVAGHLWLKDFVSEGYLEPLDYVEEDILPVIAEEMKCDGITYLSPSFCDGHMIVYQKDSMQQAVGYLPKEVITTDEFCELAKQLFDAGVQTPVALKAHSSEILLDALPYLRSKGKEIYTKQEGKVVCEIANMQQELEKYIRLKAYAPKQTHNYANDEIKDVIATGQVAMATTWSGQLGVVMAACNNKENLGFATFDTAWNVTWSFGITKASKHKGQASRLLAYLRSKEVDALAGAYCGAPVRKSNYLKNMDRYPWYKVQLEMIENYAKPMLSIAGAGDKNGVLYDTIYQAFVGNESVEEAIARAEQMLTQMA